MTPRPLTSQRKGAPKGKATSVVVFVHGYGANGADLMGLSDPLAPHLPNTAFYSPDAPENCQGNPYGFQWFPIPWLDGSSESAARAGAAQAEADLNAFLDGVLADEGLPSSSLALVGFSQGTMISLSLAPMRAQRVAGVVGFSGRLLDPARLAMAPSKPPILLIHGDADPMVPVSSLSEAADALSASGFETHTHVCKGLGHSIDMQGLSLALGFLRDRLPR